MKRKSHEQKSKNKLAGKVKICYVNRAQLLKTTFSRVKISKKPFLFQIKLYESDVLQKLRLFSEATMVIKPGISFLKQKKNVLHIFTILG